MKKGILKKSIAVTMAAVMMLSMTACGKKDSSKKEEKTDTKNMTFEGTDLALEGIEGDINTFTVSGERIYFSTYDWIEAEGTGEEDAAEEVTEEEDTGEDASEEVTEAEDAGEDASEEVTEAEDAGEDASEEVTETDDSEEDTSEEDTEEEDTGEEDASENDMEAEDIDTQDEFYGTSITRMYSMNLEGTDMKEIPIPELEQGEYLYNMLVTKEENLILLLNSWDQKTEKSSYYVVKLDAGGKEISREDITSTLKLTEEDYISKILLDDKDRLVVATDKEIKVLDDNCKEICKMKAENDYIEGVAKTKDGKIICAASGEEGAKVQVLDIDNQKWGESYKLDLSYFMGSDSLVDGIDYDFYYKDDSGIYGYDMAQKKGTKIIDYVASNISSEYSYNIVPIAKDKLLGTVWEESGSRFVVYNKVDPSTISDKITITYGAMWVDDSIKRAAIEFNKKSKDYKIELKDYSNEEDPETKMNADIIAGNVPDIIGLSSMPVEQYAAKGILEDLTPYYEKDSEVKAEDLIPSVAEAMKIDGKLYYVSPSFGISTLIASSKDVGKESGWTFDDMKALLEEKGDDVRPFYSENKVDMLNSFIYTGIDDFVDWSTGECSFDSQDFKDILEICNTGKDEEMEYNEDAPSQPTLIQEGKVLFTEGWLDMESVEMYKEMYNGDITFIGYPNKDKEGSYFTFDSAIGIYSKSEVKEGAWEFLKTFMTKEYQGNNSNVYSNPTRQDAFDMMVKAKTTTKSYTDELGQEVMPLDSSWGWDDLEVQIGPLSDEEAQMYIDLVNSIKKAGSYNTAISDIILEEAKVYFAGQKNLDETVDIIQNRVKTYVNENK
ncbi:MAG: hypothetical protein ACI4A3_00735 [Lachnospiraceae bacterium]